ncbi:hypothetical protein EDD85DRAFT_548032 [Armillaria nabsnona]|nr:hypothetical protein EDD85DRAFT_548032 [Armillaria nabsnona]
MMSSVLFVRSPITTRQLVLFLNPMDSNVRTECHHQRARFSDATEKSQHGHHHRRLGQHHARLFLSPPAHENEGVHVCIAVVGPRSTPTRRVTFCLQCTQRRVSTSCNTLNSVITMHQRRSRISRQSELLWSVFIPVCMVQLDAMVEAFALFPSFSRTSDVCRSERLVPLVVEEGQSSKPGHVFHSQYRKNDMDYVPAFAPLRSRRRDRPKSQA